MDNIKKILFQKTVYGNLPLEINIESERGVWKSKNKKNLIKGGSTMTESKELVQQEVKESKFLSAKQIQANVNLIQEVMRNVMKKDVHYGIVPGCGKKPALLKAGAEQILSTFQIAAIPEIEDLSKEDEIRYRIVCKGIGMRNGGLVGAGVGECSSSEDKYKWRAAICLEEFNAMPEDRRRIKIKAEWGKKTGEIKQIRTNPSDVANTVLKMAKKRALVDMTLTATAASDCFEQDIEDITDEMDLKNKTASNIKPPETKQTEKPKEPTKEKELTEQDKINAQQAGFN